MANIKLPTTELDFDNIKSNLKDFLRSQSQFTDYDFEGSSMSVLLDVLAYNTHYNALYKNLAINETFLDSASKRSSVVSRAKELGYVPNSATCSTAMVTIGVRSTTSTPSTLTLPAYSMFSTIINGNTYNFYTTENIVATLNTTNNTYTFADVIIREGTPLTFKYIAAAGQSYIIPNNNVDLSTLKVRVQDSISSGSFTTFLNQENLLTLTATDPIYFVKEIENQYYELEFGNDVIGKALQTGNVVNLEYLVSSLDLPNGAKTFSYQGATLLGGIVTVTTTSVAQNGSALEDIESIRYNAPRAYTTQNRAVTVEDYKSIIYQNYPAAESVAAWGGEDNVPPIYGKVFICVKPTNALLLTASEKNYILREILKPKNIVSITPELVDATFINLDLDVSVYYNPRLTTRTPEELKLLVNDTITSYDSSSLHKFTGIFRYSQLSRLIDTTEESIINNITTLKLRRDVDVKYNINSDYNINLANPIYYSGVPENSVLSTGFYVYGNTNVVYVEDLPVSNSTGVLRLFYYSNNAKVYIKKLGSIDYKTGNITLTNLNITGIVGSALQLIIKPQSNDVVSVRNQLVAINPENVNINIIVDSVAAGDAAGNANYIFTPSRN